MPLSMYMVAVTLAAGCRETLRRKAARALLTMFFLILNALNIAVTAFFITFATVKPKVGIYSGRSVRINNNIKKREK